MTDSNSKVVQNIQINGLAKLGKGTIPVKGFVVDIGSKIDRNSVMSAYNAFQSIESVSFQVGGKTVSTLKPVDISAGKWDVDGKPVKVEPHIDIVTEDLKGGGTREVTKHDARQDFHEVLRGVLHGINPTLYLAFNAKAGGGSVKETTIDRIKACKQAGMSIETAALVTGKTVETVKRVFATIK